MIELLYMVIAAEMALILTLIFKTPLRKLVLMALDKVKRGRGPVMVKTVAMTVFLLLAVNVYSIVNIQNRTIEAGGGINPTDQVLMAKHMLEASLLGNILLPYQISVKSSLYLLVFFFPPFIVTENLGVCCAKMWNFNF